MRSSALILVAWATGCSQLVSLDGLSGGAGRDGAAGTSAQGGAAGGAGSGTDAAAENDGPATDRGPTASGCPDLGRGPTMVRTGDFCIDATEVTNAQYQAFLDDRGQDTSGQPTACGWNDTFVPDQGPPPWPAGKARDSYPVSNVDWCDARAFCLWAGKRLCGRIGGGSLEPGRAGDAQQSQWASACSHAGAQPFPYGRGADATACNTGKPERADQLAPVRTQETCQGGYDGVYDLGGNVEEWVDACSGDVDGNDVCAIAGGSAFSAPAEVACASSHYTEVRKDTYSLRGFRCCSP